jgi:hypothetical protein
MEYGPRLLQGDDVCNARFVIPGSAIYEVSLQALCCFSRLRELSRALLTR